MPSYHLIGDEAFDLLLLGGYYVTPKTVLERASLNESQIDEICTQLKIEDKDKPFADKDLEKFKSALKSNTLYREAVLYNSKSAYAPTIDYFRQEGLFENEYVAIVDSGWTGSMQRSMRQILESAGYKGKLIGFYFGMYVKPKHPEDGEYLTFYFDANSGARRKAAFSNNLFECMLSANHPMTVGYTDANGTMSPVFAKPSSDKQLALIEQQIQGALEYADKKLKDQSDYNYSDAVRECYKTLKKCMVYPTKEIASVYGAFNFCDDVTEGYQMSLANPKNRAALGNYMLVIRVFRKLLKTKKGNAGELFWPYGVIAFCPAILRPWYRFNVKAWELLKAILKK